MVDHWYEEFDFEVRPKPKPKPPVWAGANPPLSRALVYAGAGFAVLVIGSLLHLLIREYGATGMIGGAVGLGALSFLMITIVASWKLKEPYTEQEILGMGYCGGCLGLFSGFCLIPVLLWLGYDDDPKARKQEAARFAALDAAFLQVANRPLPPWDRLHPKAVAALQRLPDHPLDRIKTVAELIKRLDNPDPVVQAEVVLALGRYEGLTSQILPLLTARLGFPDPRIRAAATVALAGMRPWTPELEALIFARLTDPDERVQSAAVTAVVQVKHFLPDRGSMDRLRAAVKPGQLTTRRKIAVLLQGLAER